MLQLSGRAFAAQTFYFLFTVTKTHLYTRSSLTSSLLWMRLLPSPAFPLGILPGIILISLPLWLGLWFALRGRLNHLHPIRLIVLGLILAVLFIGCLVVSVKIGGGADLHDLDSIRSPFADHRGLFFCESSPTRIRICGMGHDALAGACSGNHRSVYFSSRLYWPMYYV